MRLQFVSVCGFRGYRKPVRIDFGRRFTVIDGRNGTGKSTIFDAIEFALTGALSKYNDAKAAGESVADYLWWTGLGPSASDHYVEVGFSENDETFVVRRTLFDEPPDEFLEVLKGKLYDRAMGPPQALAQLCSSSIIRDEQITQLSLDLKEGDRYALLRDSLGATDAEFWLDRGSQLAALAKKRVATAQQEVAAANGDVGSAARRLDEVRMRLVSDDVVGEAAARLRTLIGTAAPADQLSGPARKTIAGLQAQIESLSQLGRRWAMVERARANIPTLTQALRSATDEQAASNVALDALRPIPTHPSASAQLDAKAKALVSLVELGRGLGLNDGRCPLCAAGRSHDEFSQGMESAIALARQLSDTATSAAQLEKSRSAIEQRLSAAQSAIEQAQKALEAESKSISDFDRDRASEGLDTTGSLEDLLARSAHLKSQLDTSQRDLRVLDTLQASVDLEKAQRTFADANSRLARAQERFGRARRAETTAHALHDAARRAAGESLDRRLERVLPLLAELYRRLRPHPAWSEIEYSIRGDVRRFMKLQVGDQLNPQFLFSSGQRRATGLAFLLSVHLSLAWNRWKSILLDDPVQHIDDFRTVHLAEVLGHLVAEGRQVICAVEDSALADLICRRLPVGQPGEAIRITLGPDQEGAASVLEERQLVPLSRRSLLVEPLLAAS